MKKQIKKLMLPLLALALLATGCTKEIIVDGGTHMRTVYFTVNPAEWQTQTGLGYCFAEKYCPEITDDVIRNGAVMVYFIDEDNYDNQLPYLVPYYQELEDGTEGLFFENLRYDLKTGCVTFIVQQNDRYVSIPSVSMRYKVVIFSR